LFEINGGLILNSFPTSPPSLLDSAPFIVIGSGIAGLYTALELSKMARVILITKASIAESNTNYAQGGIASAIGSNDSPEFHYQDTIMAGAGLCNSEAVTTIVHEGIDRVKHLIDLGVPFDQNQGELSFTKEAAHSRRRILHAEGDATGHAISQTLIRHVQQANIAIYEQHFALALVTKNGQCCGVVTIHNQCLNLFLASAVILCSGGAGQIYDKTTNPQVATGDGLILAYQAGAVLKDLEFIQFHPTALSLPSAPPFLISESVRGEGAILLNAFGERFMPRYHKSAELAPRDVVARAIFQEIHAHDNSSVFLDLSKIESDSIQLHFPNIFSTCLKYGLDIRSQPIPVAPAAHYMMGGIMTDLYGRTSVPGLYAAGEAAATGVHGANRLASNSLLEGLVFAGRIADYLKAQPYRWPIEEVNDLTIHYPILLRSYEQWPDKLIELRRVTSRYLGIIRDDSGLHEAEQLLLTSDHTAKPEFELNPSYFEFQNMLRLAGMIAQAAGIRQESRGGHYRSDFPDSDPNWLKHIHFHDHKIEVIVA
jgi:L-aspartate oxidase